MNEALYMKVAQYLQLRVHRDAELHGKTLFIPRFDRKVINGKVGKNCSGKPCILRWGRRALGLEITIIKYVPCFMEACTKPKQEISSI